MSVPTGTVGVFHKKGPTRHNPGHGPGAGRGEFPLHETHGIALWPQHRLLCDSRGLGWHEVYTSLAAERSWNRTLHAVPHLCIAYCLHRPAAVSRRIDAEPGLADVELRPRMLGVVPENRASTWTLRGAPDIQLVYLRRAMVERVAEEVLGTDASRVELVPGLAFADPLIEQLMLALLGAARADPGGSDGLYADHLAWTMAVHLLCRHSTRPRAAPAAPDSRATRDARMRHVRELIESALDEDLSLERLAREAGVSPHAFSAAFVRVFDTTPHRYVLSRRIERAKALLRDTDAPIADVALRTGFASQSHLAAVFRRAVAVTPRAYRHCKRGD